MREVHGQSILLIGASGRVGQALVASLPHLWTGSAIGRYDVRHREEYLRALSGMLSPGDVVVNAAGSAHLHRRPSSGEVLGLVTANVLLPIEIAACCLRKRAHFVHISSAKASLRTVTAGDYAWSKRVSDELLIACFGDDYQAAGLALLIVRPPALLIAPFDAGKLRRLRGLRYLPECLVPRFTVPVLTREQFVSHMAALVMSPGIRPGVSQAGVSVVEFERKEFGDLRSVRSAMMAR